MPRVPKEKVEQLAATVLALRDETEFRTFWLGTRLKGPIGQQEAEELKRACNRAVCLRVLELRPDLEPKLEEPDAVITLHYEEAAATIRPKPLLLYGRYLKFSREVPQSRWHCRRCRGRGCEICGGTGRRFTETVQEMVAAPILKACRGADSKMHSVGREDVDARMLGSGRPFVIELTEPRVRTINVPKLQAEINAAHSGKIEIRELQPADRALTRRVDTMSPDKSYRASVTCLSPVEPERLQRLDALSGVEIAQETPRRVLHRRANRVRKRAIINLSIENTRQNAANRAAGFDLLLRVESGTYIKELVSGDEGRTVPSVAQILGAPCECDELDVLEIHCDPLLERP